MSIICVGIWHQMVHESNTTEVDPLGLPTGMMYDYREVCRQVDKKDKAYLLPIYRKKNKDFHAEVIVDARITIKHLLKT